MGLGRALKHGLTYCKNEWVARMDSDDIACENRFEKQFEFIENNGLDICGAAVNEFINDKQIISCRSLPEHHADLIKFARKRNPFNHPCVVFQKGMVETVGGYRHMPFFEDYDLWARMILVGARMGNYPESLLYMRVSTDFYKRRSGWRYCRDIARFWREMERVKFCGWFRCRVNIMVRCAVSLLPSETMRMVYRSILRKKKA
jgi:glycosyltransferase involved in cell wall biosynthesis